MTGYIGYLCGTILERTPPTICVNVAGVGYNIGVSMNTYYQLGPIGSPISLFIHPIVREDAHLLYGFLSTKEREVFQKILRVSGIGPRTALSILSGLSVDEFIRSVSEKKSDILERIPGIGKKTASRLLLELQDKLSHETELTPFVSSQNEVTEALLALGYSLRETQTAVNDLPTELSVADRIRQALKILTKKLK